MLWAIGDIHGMLNPLERILDAIGECHRTEEPVEKIVFLGDYIDHGRHSRQVLDRLLSLGYPAVFLAGNHEDLFRRYGPERGDEDGFFRRNFFENGGGNTLGSFEWEEGDWDLFWEVMEGEVEGRAALEGEYAKVGRYAAFFRDLAYSHRETFGGGASATGFSFFHGLPRLDQPLEMQRARDFSGFEAYRRARWRYLGSSELDAEGQYGIGESCDRRRREDGDDCEPPRSGSEWIAIDDTFLWGRGYSYRFPYEGEVIVHGHTPTPRYGGYYSGRRVAPHCERQFRAYDGAAHLPFLFSRAEGAGYEGPGEGGGPSGGAPVFRYSCGRGGAVEAINIDTACVYRGGALTALGISGERLARGELLILTAPTVPQDGPQRSLSLSGVWGKDKRKDGKKDGKKDSPRPAVLKRTVQASRFGADMTDADRNRPFPFEICAPR
ncbi:MAG: metallophosphoesterase [Deltaproteobacteria bacterium]|jgi:hypothetical protein|nr:metallophosphoesterase [Deltaproteobacteria bacterium]